MPSTPRRGSWSPALCYVGSALLVSTGLIVVTGQPLGAREPVKPSGCGAVSKCHSPGENGYQSFAVSGRCSVGCGTCDASPCNGTCHCAKTANSSKVDCFPPGRGG